MNPATIKFFFIIINFPRFLCHIIAYSASNNKHKIDADIKASMSLWGYNYGPIVSLVYLLWYDIYFRTLFYKRIGRISRILSLFAKDTDNFVIDNTTDIDEGMLCVHPFSTVINAKRIGKNFVIRNDVTIGNNDANVGMQSRPTIGDNVTINVHSVVVGDIIIGNNVTIGAGCVLLKSVPDNCVVVGNPARIIRRNGQVTNEKL